jgi:protein-disulfide isomerase
VDRRFLIVLAVLILGLGGLFIFTRNKASAPSNNTVSTVSNHVEGLNTKKVELLVYGDFECSACAAFHPIEKQVVNKYFNDISYTFRHFPLDNIHPNARAASRAAEAAGLQGKFFEMHDMLYENQDSWLSLSQPLTAFKTFATTLGLDVNRFETDFASETVNSTINADKKEGESRGIDGTPTFFLNGEKLNNADISTVDGFSAKIEAAIQAASH